jgi:Uma2 family endonuclease
LTISQLPDSSSTVPPARGESAYDNLAEFLHALGDISPHRVLLDPPPGTATEQDMLLLVERDKRMVELIDGTLVEKGVGSIESIIATSIATAISNFIKPRKIGIVAGEAFMARMRTGRVRMPDVSFVSFDRFPDRIFPKSPITPLGPDLAVEVLSVTNTRAEMDQKLKEYFSSGTRLAWIADPDTETLEVYLSPEKPVRVLTIAESVDGGDVLPGFSMTLQDIFHPYEGSSG